MENGRNANLAKYGIWTCAGLVAVWMIAVGFPDEASALLLVLLGCLIFIFMFRRLTDEKDFVTNLFLAALVIRLGFGIAVHIYDLREFFGGDALTYNSNGARILDYWNGLVDPDDTQLWRATSTGLPGWGMNYLVAGIYYITGKNILASQSFCAVIGAATAPMVYFCSTKIFSNRSVARTAALTVAFFPSFVIWSSQLLKDGLVIFLLVVAITMVLHLQERISYGAILALVLSLFGIISLRFYIFYMVAVAVAGSFIIGLSEKSTSVLRRAVVFVIIGLGLTYMGVLRNASVDFERYVDLDRVQSSRLDLSRSESGFGEDTDISTTEGAISAMPVGFAYLMFAPFPWQISSFRQAITIPEVLIWWAMMPLMISGIVFAVRHQASERISDPVFQSRAHTGVLDLPGKCRNGVPSANSDPGFPFHLHRRRVGAAQGAQGK